MKWLAHVSSHCPWWSKWNIWCHSLYSEILIIFLWASTRLGPTCIKNCYCLIYTPSQCPGQEPTSVVLVWLVAWLGLMGLKEIVIALCWRACVVILLSNFSLCLLCFWKNSPKHCWSSYSITLHSGPKPWLQTDKFYCRLQRLNSGPKPWFEI